jgi:hypothetical protein
VTDQCFDAIARKGLDGFVDFATRRRPKSVIAAPARP